MRCFTSSLCLSSSSPPNTLLFATPVPPLNYGAAKDLSRGMAGDGAFWRAGWSLGIKAKGSAPLPWHCQSSSGSGERFWLARSFLRSLEIKPLYPQR